MDTGPISDFFDREAGQGEARLGPVSRLLLDSVEWEGLAGRSVLELGCGRGALALEMLRRGASRVTGIDLSERSVEAARRAAEREDLARRAEFRAGDAAGIAVDPHDVVLSDKVLCCYPDPTSLLERSLPETGAVYAFALPASRGLRGAAARVALGLENAWRRLRGDPFRAFVHDVPAIDARVREAGMDRVRRAHVGMWHVAVYRRVGT